MREETKKMMYGNKNEQPFIQNSPGNIKCMQKI